MDKIVITVLLLVSAAGAQTKLLSLSEGNKNCGADLGSASGLFYSEPVTQLLSDNDLLFMRPMKTNQSTNRLTGILSQDLFSTQPDTLSHKDSLEMFETRSSLKAGLFSLIVPGAGQFYNGGTGNYIKAAGFLALEVAAIAVNVIWTNKGNNQTIFFQNYADANFSVLRYAQWIQLNFNGWDPGANSATKNLVNEIFDVNTGTAPWQKVDFEKLNEVESILGQTSSGQFFSHNLAAHGTQDYYEIIGKYPQFRQGWNPNAATDNVNITYDQLKDDVETQVDYYYMQQRGDANNFYGVAGTALGVVIANHFLSAIEAAIWAHGHNKSIQTSIGMSPLPQGARLSNRNESGD